MKNTKLTTAQLRKIELEERISRIEEAQKRTRVKIEQLNTAKVELSRLQAEAEKTITNKNTRIKGAQQAQAQELMKLNQQVQTRNTQYQKLKQEFEINRNQSQRDIQQLKEERDKAIEKQKLLEKEKMEFLRYGGNDSGLLKGLSVGLGLGVLCIIAFMVIVFKTTLLDSALCNFKADSPTWCQVMESRKRNRLD